MNTTAAQPALNGTSAGALAEGYRGAIVALESAVEALYAARPHGRDYYVQGDNAHAAAAREHKRADRRGPPRAG
jgi:hypothetical protein